MKSSLYDSSGKKKSDIEIPLVFSTPIREDMVLKFYEADKFSHVQPYSSYEEAGKRHSASGTISHRRHEWKGQYGKGISRVPRKVMWRRGTQFYWVGAEVSNTRGGRRAHPPKGLISERKTNKKERKQAFCIALAATAREFYSLINSILGPLSSLAIQKREVRAGIGKRRGRKYKSNAGLLVIKSKSEKVNFRGVDIKSPEELKISDLYPLGRLTIYTQKSLEELKDAS